MNLYLVAAIAWIVFIPVMTGALMRSNEGNMASWLIYAGGIFWPLSIAILVFLAAIVIIIFVIQKLYDFGYWIVGVLEHLD